MSLLEQHNLVYDAMGDLRKLKEVALKFPKVTIVLNHLGGPGPVDQPAEKLDEWKENIAALAEACPNVVVKCGGFQMVNGNMGLEKRPTPVGSEELCELVLPYYQQVIECFGPKRCMFGAFVIHTWVFWKVR